MNELAWFFGRGASVACGLTWTAPETWALLARPELESHIRAALLAEMTRPEIDTSPYRQLLAELTQRTCTGRSHVFLTTNWDTLLEHEIDIALVDAPDWLPNTHVFHLNGTVDQPENDRRSPMLVENDPPIARKQSLEFDVAVAALEWCQRFVVVGMSFACQTDQALLTFLHSVRDKRPVGVSRWVVVNPDERAARDVAARIQSELPDSRARCVSASFKDWIHHGMRELVDAGVLRPLVPLQ